MFEDANRKTISDKWLTEVIYPALDKINLAYFRVQHGCSDVMEFISESEHTIDEIKYVNLGILISSVDFILINGRALFTKAEHSSLKDKINILREFYRNETATVIYNDLLKKQVFTLDRNSFNIVAKHIIEVHGELISCLQPILFLEGNLRINK